MAEEKQSATSDFMNWLKAASSAPTPSNPLFEFALNHTQEEVDQKLNQLAKAFEGFSVRAPEIGDEMEDGTILAGYYKGKPLYTTLKDAPGTYTFNEAARYATTLAARGRQDWHAPTRGQLNVLYENRNKGKLKGTFNETGSDPAGWYWSSSPDVNLGGLAFAQRFSDGFQLNLNRDRASSLRCVC